MMSKVDRLLRRAARAAFKQEAKLSPSAWIEKNLVLSSATSARLPGPYRFRNSPYWRQVCDDLANPRISRLVIEKSAQIGASELLSNLILYYSVTDIAPIILVMPSAVTCREFADKSIRPKIQDTAALQQFRSEDKDDERKTEWAFTNGVNVKLKAGGSPTALGSNSCKYLFLDECDKYVEFDSKGEAPALELSLMRVESYGRDAKVVMTSTPTDEGTSQIHKHYMRGSQSRFFVPCPHCSFKQILSWDGIKWDETTAKDSHGDYDLDAVEASTRYQCASPDCKKLINEREKFDMINGGEWRATNLKPYPSNTRSYKISALYSLTTTWGAIATKFLLSKDDRGARQNFNNSILGDVNFQYAANIKESDLDAIIKDSPVYNRGELIEAPVALIAAIDVQGTLNGIWGMVVARYANGANAVIDWFECATFDDVREVIKKQYRVRGAPAGEVFTVRAGVMDIGHRREEVAEFCLRSNQVFFPIQGKAEENGLKAPVRLTHYTHKGAPLRVLQCNDSLFKQIIVIDTIQQRINKLYLPQDNAESSPSGQTPYGILKKQLVSEYLKEQGGKMVWCKKGHNEFLDVLKYAWALLYFESAYLEHAPRLEPDTAKRLYELANPNVPVAVPVPAPAAVDNVEVQYSNGGGW